MPMPSANFFPTTFRRIYHGFSTTFPFKPFSKSLCTFKSVAKSVASAPCCLNQNLIRWPARSSFGSWTFSVRQLFGPKCERSGRSCDWSELQLDTAGKNTNKWSKPQSKRAWQLPALSRVAVPQVREGNMFEREVEHRMFLDIQSLPGPFGFKQVCRSGGEIIIFTDLNFI